MKKLLLFFSIIVLSACSTYHVVDIDILTPSEYQVKPNTYNVVLLNNAEEQSSDIGHSTYKQKANYGRYSRKRKVSDDDIKVDSTTVNSLDLMKASLSESMMFSSIDIGRYDAIPDINYNNINNTFNQYPADALIVLESLNYHENLTRIYYEYHEVEEKEVEVIIQSQWLIYYAENPNPASRFSSKDTFYWNEQNPNRAECVKIAVWENAREAAKKISPYWISVNRLYFTGSTFVYSEVDENIKVQDWEGAAKLWMSVFKGEKKSSKKKARMAFNMALFFEMKNDIETALMWLGTANEIFTEKSAESELEMCALYVKVLDQRLINQEKLNEQLAY